jgi:hypothetical protein
MSPTTASPKINLYNLGSLGVNRVLSPVHKTDGEYLQAQNAQSDKHNQGRDAIKKRWGMTIYNASAFGASVIAIHNLPYGGFADPTTGTTGSTGSTASWAGWTEPFATWQRDGPGYWDGTPYVWSTYGTWIEPPWISTAYGSLKPNANMTTTGKYYSAVLGDYDLTLTQGDIVEYDVMTPAYALKSAPPAAPGINPASGNGWRICAQDGDPDFVAITWLGYSLASGYEQWAYTYQVSADAWNQVGDKIEYGTGSTYPMQYRAQDYFNVFSGKIYRVHEQKKQSNSTGKHVYTIESAPATSTGSWTVEYTWDGDVTYESNLTLHSDGAYIYAFGRIGGSTGGGAPYTYVNKRSDGGGSWADVPAVPNSTYAYILNIDKERTTGGVLFAYGDGFNPGGGTVYPLMVSTDQSSSWTTVSQTDAGWPTGIASSVYSIWRAGDQYFIYCSPDGFNNVVLQSSASTAPTFNWTTVSDLGEAVAAGASGQIMSLTPRTKF